ncbi:protein translocase subunit SecA-like [Wyeomyia smithii]|uniref:protein translocase subunit SecA-like n=1 Tax=Wyeomyia smithii TaxID=174621 RepID=UPI002468061F|nr:protein translocase subunit SecA-like [Wyeomyia smithii]
MLVFLQQPKDKGQLSQMQTGEGKTVIVSVLAAIKVLQGEKVDVVTSNPVLAAEGVRDRKLFFDLLNVDVDTNNADEKYSHGKRACYEADIVYGSIGNFQFDYLRDSFMGLETRAGRTFENIMLDEVDSMIIDNASHIAKLSGPFPGMENLRYVYIKIWIELHKAEEIVVREHQQRLKSKAEELSSGALPEAEAQQAYDQLRSELESEVLQRTKELIRLAKPTEIEIIPSHIREYAVRTLDRWIDSAIKAKYHYAIEEQYVIREDGRTGELLIQPVDYANTGITLKNTNWQYGLHQFLQLKHNLHLMAEIRTKIFGPTGTLGSEAEQQLLASIYNVGFARIPTYKDKKFFEIGGEVVDDELFGEQIVEDTLLQLQRGRSSLIICETIKDAKRVQEEIKTITERSTVSRTKCQRHREESSAWGTFLPCNKRVEDQAFGRTARQGNNGTAKLMVKQSEVEKLGAESYLMREIKVARGLNEASRIRFVTDVKVKELEFQDGIYELFSTLYRELKEQYKAKKGENQYVLDDLKAFWAFWLEVNGFQEATELVGKRPEVEFERFKLEAQPTIGGAICFNPYYSIKQAEYFIQNEKQDRAEQAANHALTISGNPDILHSAYIKLFEISIERGEVLLDKFRQAIGDLFFIPAARPDRESEADEFSTILESDDQQENLFLKHLLSKQRSALA